MLNTAANGIGTCAALAVAVSITTLNLNRIINALISIHRGIRMRRAIWKCENCVKRCTVRTAARDRPTKCLYWFDYPNWIRIDKHKPEIDDYE